jgi:hypothetical protein
MPSQRQSQSLNITYGSDPRYSSDSIMSSSSVSYRYPASTRPTSTMGTGYAVKVESHRVPDQPKTGKIYAFNVLPNSCAYHSARIASDPDFIKSVHRSKVSVHLQEKGRFNRDEPRSSEAQPFEYNKSKPSKSK